MQTNNNEKAKSREEHVHKDPGGRKKNYPAVIQHVYGEERRWMEKKKQNTKQSKQKPNPLDKLVGQQS